MGRHYNGDIEGKFWFGIQSSNDADNFGQQGQTPNCLEYYYSKDDLPNVNKGIDECVEALGPMKNKLDRWFKKSNCYNERDLAKRFNITENKLSEYLEYYARLHLGIQIKDCIVEKGYCEFEAEL